MSATLLGRGAARPFATPRPLKGAQRTPVHRHVHLKASAAQTTSQAPAATVPAMLHVIAKTPQDSPYFDGPLDAITHVVEVFRAHTQWTSGEFFSSVDDEVLIAGTPYPYVVLHRLDGSSAQFAAPADVFDAHTDFADAVEFALEADEGQDSGFFAVTDESLAQTVIADDAGVLTDAECALVVGVVEANTSAEDWKGWNDTASDAPGFVAAEAWTNEADGSAVVVARVTGANAGPTDARGISKAAETRASNLAKSLKSVKGVVHTGVYRNVRFMKGGPPVGLTIAAADKEWRDRTGRSASSETKF
ncbi:hypothetical protein RI054_02g07580 [Pseudoscourfieldia marina]